MRRLIVVSMVAALLLAMPAFAERRYRDSTGENRAAVDISGVTVSNDATTGDVEFTVLVKSGQLEKELIGGQVSVDVFIDADRNRDTGNPQGFDAEVSTDAGVQRWDGKEMLPQAGTLSFGYSVNTFDVSLPGKRILLTRPKQSFAFLVVSHRMTSNHDAVDVAPNHGVYAYTLAGPPPLAHVVTTAVAVTVTPAAGQLFAVGQFSAGLSDGTTAAIANQRCSASIAGVPIPSRSANDCTWLLPRASRGKRLVVLVRGRYRGHLYTKRLTYLIA